MKQDFVNDFENEEAKLDAQEEAVLDALLEVMREAFKMDQGATYVLNIHRYEQIQFVWNVLNHLTAGQNVEITFRQSDWLPSMGCITLKARSLEFTDSEWFSRAAEFAENVDIYPLLADCICMDFTFYGLADKLN